MRFDTIEGIVENIERMHPHAIKGWVYKYVYVLTPEIDRYAHLDTSFQDLADVGIDHFCWINPLESMHNMCIHNLRTVKHGEFRNRLRAVPPGTFVYELLIPAVEDLSTLGTSSEHWESFTQKYPIVQKKQYDKPEDAFAFLDLNKAFSVSKEKPLYASKVPELSKEISHGLNAAFEMEYMWGICYEWQGMCFVFSMEHEEMKQLLARRDKQGKSRRSVIPHVVKEHERNGRLIPMHLRMSSDNTPFRINGRDYCIMVNPETIETAFNYKNGMNRLLKIRDELNECPYV